MDGLLKIGSGEGSQRKEESYREIFHILREHLSKHEENVDGNIVSRGHSMEVSDENEKDVIGQWGKER